MAQKPETPTRPAPASRWSAPFLWSEWCLEWCIFGLSRLAIFRLLEYGGKFTLIIGVIVYVTDNTPEKRNQRAIAAAWDVVASQEGKKADAGRRHALQLLNQHDEDLSGVALDGVYLQGIALDGATLRSASFPGAKLSEARLAGADLRGAKLRDADLREADLSSANLHGADLRGADLRGVVLDYAFLKATTISERTKLDAKWMLVWELLNQPTGEKRNLAEADLIIANLHGVQLPQADLSGARLSGAFLNDADLRGANLLNTDLRGANPTGANLSDAQGLTAAQIAGAITDANTRLPDGLTVPATLHRAP